MLSPCELPYDEAIAMLKIKTMKWNEQTGSDTSNSASTGEMRLVAKVFRICWRSPLFARNSDSDTLNSDSDIPSVDSDEVREKSDTNV